MAGPVKFGAKKSHAFQNAPARSAPKAARKSSKRASSFARGYVGGGRGRGSSAPVPM